MSNARRAEDLSSSLEDEVVDYLLAHKRAVGVGLSAPPLPEGLRERLSEPEWVALQKCISEQLDRYRTPQRPDDSEGEMDTPTDSVKSPNAGVQPSMPGYDILGEVGRGGMGVVYKARDKKLKRLVALKLILAGAYSNEATRQRFRTEAEAVARLHHSNIVQIYEVGDYNDLPFLALEFVDGGSLHQNIAGKPQPVRKSAETVEVLARAMHYAHERGVVHRDLKPANVLVGSNGGVKVSDFGLAKQIDRTVYTPTNAILGTPAYMSPEQADGRMSEVGRVSDVYALGVILYELLTGRPPFQGASEEKTYSQVINQEPVPPQKLVPAVPRDVDTICLKCLQKDPAQRYPTADALAEDLRCFLNGQPITARPIGATARAWRWCRRNKLIAMLTTTAAVLLVLTAIVATVAAFQFSAKAAVETKARLELEDQLYANRIAVAERELFGNYDVGLASALLEQCPERLRGWEWNYLMRLRDGGRAPLVGHEGGLWSAMFSPDGRRIATASIDGTVRVWDVTGGGPPFVFRGHEIQIPFAPRVPVKCVAFSPDGLYVASGSLAPNLKNLEQIANPRQATGIVKIWDVKTGQVAVTFDQQTGLVNALAFSPDGTRIASSSIAEDNSIAVWDATSGRDVRLVRGHVTHVHGLRFSPDGRLLASSSTDGIVKLWDTATLREIRTFVAHPAPVYDVAFSADSTRLASASVDGTVGVWDVATGGAALKPLRGHTGTAMGVAFSPDGRHIATAGYDKTVRLWDAVTGVEKITLRGHTDLVSSVAFSPDGQQLVSASFDRTARIWDASPVEEVRVPGIFTLREHEERVNAVAFSRDGRLLASGGWDKTIRLWDGETGEAIQSLAGHKGAVWGIAFSPDGRRLASASWDRSVKIWDIQTGRELLTFSKHPTPLQGVAFSPDGRTVASCSFEGLVKIWDANTGEEVVDCAGHLFPATAVAFSPDGKQVVTGSGDRTAKIWQAETGRELITLKGHSALVNGVTFSPDGERVATASWDQTVKLWEAKTGKEQLTLQGHVDRVQGVAFSPDGTLVATASEDKTVRIWDAKTGREVLPARRHRGIVWSVSFSPDGKRVAAGSWSLPGEVRTWAAKPEK